MQGQQVGFSSSENAENNADNITVMLHQKKSGKGFKELGQSASSGLCGWGLITY